MILLEIEFEAKFLSPDLLAFLDRSNVGLVFSSPLPNYTDKT
jgi:hypothetical protein